MAWCSWRRVTTFAGESRAGQLGPFGPLAMLSARFVRKEKSRDPTLFKPSLDFQRNG